MKSQQGTLGASGDLAPLAHLALGLMGEGKMWNPKTQSWQASAEILKERGLEPLHLQAKEGLALINGTQLISALGAEAVARSEMLAKTADIICAITLDALEGTVKAYDPQIHNARPHKGQIRSAQHMRSLLHSATYPSTISLNHANCNRVQDAYSLRCAPQVHGVAYDTLTFVKGIIETEMNSATDNPMVFADTEMILSGGNFHGEFPSKALDYLAIAVHELANISERRVERLVNSTLSGLPAFLVKEGGLNSGFMIAHCTSAALVSENKTLAHPASIDSIPTSAEKEDHVSMGGWAARKCLKIVENVENVLAIELLAACQGIDLRRPLRTTAPLEAVHALVRTKVATWEKDRYLHPDIEAAAEMIRSGQVVAAVEHFLRQEIVLSSHHEYH
jgi:histidine ammonia-lyase